MTLVSVSLSHTLLDDQSKEGYTYLYLDRTPVFVTCPPVSMERLTQDRVVQGLEEILGGVVGCRGCAGSWGVGTNMNRIKQDLQRILI